ncbi:hypothetical protein TcasGA2_TC031769 [Tribolium castaneum]|uniref:Uncharacterized protein n=1 Tax=Tribolium castaneum TaxID=7070 RepID=A0A139W9M2_TRICA|nr:hypothetical protein TcasGA2_TC031769 [Tribolium castaneum]
MHRRITCNALKIVSCCCGVITVNCQRSTQQTSKKAN